MNEIRNVRINIRMNNKNEWYKECTRMNVRMNNKNEWGKESKDEC